MTRTQVDHNAIKFGQVTIVVVVALAWLFARIWLVPVLAVALLFNAAWPTIGPLRLLYRYLVLPLRLVRPHLVTDEAAPHRFAQAVGGALMLGASAALYGGVTALGWVLAGVVAVLAAVNVLWNFCAGCFLFYQLRRAGLLRGERPA
ncbi:MAG: DUF4395 domain-containing protein [Armatimonadota bacterium]|nr:DUF4395 domain-containing protein [Armatimonadota bacterium]MDR7426671.1 DUF4395 domain-containing protein [Armatimonadota bacterium]MDR7464378.1 DUF4395 domain-containing protein [Armatimonadota bacterium]MDR7469222.1 DUF4395 domain-containing protein [Armatimonadota bacterium]MDR7475067.1 DUF4395 domain-containing protein [Armatimonadota bacterium]